MKNLFLTAILMLAFSAHAGSNLLSPVEVQQRNLAICRSLDKAIDSAGDIAQNLQKSGDKDAASYASLNEGLIRTFVSLECSKEIEESEQIEAANKKIDADAATAKKKSCARLNREYLATLDKELDGAMNSNPKRDIQLERQLVSLDAQLTNQKCKNALRNK